MRLAEARFIGFKRFTDLRITGIPAAAKLVVLAGPNGSGKSSIFDAFRTWAASRGGGGSWDESYGAKVGAEAINWASHVDLSFHDGVPEGPDSVKKLVYIRSAFRNEAEVQVSSLARLASPVDSPRINRLIDNDVSVSDNYQLLIMQSVDGLFDSAIPDAMSKGELRDRIIGSVQRAMAPVFPDLQLHGISGVGSGGNSGSFYFDKGESKRFLFKNLSAGEKAAFDLILDVVIKREYFDDSIWCIDEPETHLNTRVQGLVLETLLDLLPDSCQLFIASHSIGFMRKARDLARSSPGSVAFIDLEGLDFDQPVSIGTVTPTRDFWSRTLDVALGDLAELVAPEQLILCEGRPPRGQNDRKAAFDANCYSRIFGVSFPNTEFISVGNSDDAGGDRLDLGRTIQALVTGTQITRLIDRDMRTPEEVAMLTEDGVHVLSRRHLEAYLLDDEVIGRLCETVGQPDRITDALAVKADEIAQSVQERGNDPDDLKSAAGGIYKGLRRLLKLTGAGSDWNAFARDTLCPLVAPGTAVYEELRTDIFD